MKHNSWYVSPPIIVTLTAAVIIAGMLLAGWLSARRYRVRARVEIAEPVLESQSGHTPAAGNPIPLPDGEVARTAARVREAAGLLMGLAALAVTEQMHHRPIATADSLIELLARRNLLPPGVRQAVTGKGLISVHATLSVRFRPAPLGLEIVSVPNEQANGPAIIARLAASGEEATGALLMMAKKADTVIPEAFAPLSQVLSADWSVEPLRERAFTTEEIEQLNAWAQQYAAK